METLDIVHNETPYEPTTEQTKRAAELRRFNLMFVYLPFGLVAAIVIALIVIMLMWAINPPDESGRSLLSGLADAALVLALLPFLLVGAGLVVLAGYVYSQARKRGTAPVARTQRLLWQLDALVGRLKVRTEATTGLVVRPFLSINGGVAYLKMLITQLVSIVKRS